MKKFIFFVSILIFSQLCLFSASSFQDGLSLFKENSVEEALSYFEEALITEPSEDVYKYLAESYNILGMHDDEALVLEEAVSSNIGDPSYFNFKLGNAYHLTGNYKGALESYLNVLTLNNGFVNEAFLNIANVSVELKLYSSAVDNYTKYLELEPNSPQKRKIIKMIFILKKMQKDELAKVEEENRAREAERVAQEEEARKAEEDRLSKIALNEKLEADREAKARELEEERLLYASEEKSLYDDKKEFEIAEEKVVNPPDPDIEEQRRVLQLREEELNEREKRIIEAENALKQAELALEESRRESEIQEPMEPKILTEEELLAQQRAKELEEFNQKKIEEEMRQQALMNDILQSLEKIGENAKGLNASSEGAYGELEGSDIDE